MLPPSHLRPGLGRGGALRGVGDDADVRQAPPGALQGQEEGGELCPRPLVVPWLVGLGIGQEEGGVEVEGGVDAEAVVQVLS